MEQMCLSKVNFSSNIAPRIFKESHEFRKVMPTKDQVEDKIES